jgi:hypothetical protein
MWIAYIHGSSIPPVVLLGSLSIDPSISGYLDTSVLCSSCGIQRDLGSNCRLYAPVSSSSLARLAVQYDFSRPILSVEQSFTGGGVCFSSYR